MYFKLRDAVNRFDYKEETKVMSSISSFIIPHPSPSPLAPFLIVCLISFRFVSFSSMLLPVFSFLLTSQNFFSPSFPTYIHLLFIFRSQLETFKRQLMQSLNDENSSVRFSSHHLDFCI